MSWYHNLWPFDQKKAEQRRKTEQAFQAQLKEAIQRRGDLEEAARQLREDRERREIESLRPSRPRLISQPSLELQEH